jgi:hypothetical protein
MSLGTTGKLILAFVTLLLGVVLIGTIASEGLHRTDKLVVVGEQHAFTAAVGDVNITKSYTVTNAPTGWKSEDCPLTAITIKNVTGVALTLTTDYTITPSTGVYYLKNTTATCAMVGTDNNTYVDYTYCGDDYMNSTWGRTSINLVAGFFALGILLTSVGLFYSAAKDTGII